MKQIPPLYVLTTLIILFFFAGFTPQARSQAKTTISGWLRTGVDYIYNDRFSESFFRGKVQFEFDLSNKLEAQIDIRGESDTHQMELREAFMTADLGKAVALDFGQGKKRFGIEFQKSKEFLLTVERTLIYRRLEPLGFVGRDLNLRYYRTARPDGRRNGLSLSLGYSEDHSTTFIGHWTRLNTIGSLALGGSALLQNDQISGGSQTVWGLGAELLRDAPAHHFEMETVIGQDPFQSEFEKTLGDGKNVYFFAGKILYGHRFNISSEKTKEKSRKAIEPVIVLSLWTPDIDAFELNTAEFLLGLNLHLTSQLRIGLNGDLLLTKTSEESDERSHADSNGILQVQLVW